MEPKECPKCKSENIYNDGNFWVCPECANEWNLSGKDSGSDANASDEGASASAVTNAAGAVKDANGNELKTGDSVVVIKELKIKGASSAIKVGTKVKNIRIVDGEDGHDISCKIDGIGSIYLKSEFVRKA